MTTDKPIPILGAGMAGFGAAYRLRQENVPSIMYERKPYYGGHTATYTYDSGFLFDDGPHISFTKDSRIQDLFSKGVDGRYETIQARVNNHWKGHWIKHPAQCNLHGLPEDLLVKILRDFIDAQHQERPISNYRDWLYASFGKTFADTFPAEYGKKYHTTAPENMSTDWLGPRLYRPDLEEVLLGALTSRTPEVHYVSHFRYPTEGGFISYVHQFVPMTDLRLEHDLVALDASERELEFANGYKTSYDMVISSLPLPELVARITDAPADVKEAVAKLACSECVSVNIGVDREDLSEYHWTYFYDDDYLITRVNFPHMFSPNNTPPGAGSIQVEVYFSDKYRPRDRKPDECIEPVIQDLKHCGLIREDDRILHKDARLVPYANIIFDLDRAPALEVVKAYLQEIGVAPCGRYGEWGYHWTDESFKSGEEAAEKVLDAVAL